MPFGSFVIDRESADLLAADDQFAYLGHVKHADGRTIVVTVPIPLRTCGRRERGPRP